MINNNKNFEKKEEKENILEKNRTICRLLNIQLGDFFDDIYIPFHFFKDNDWNISKILYDNEDSLFYNKKYLTDEDEEYFHRIFSKYITMIEDIFSPDSKLYNFLKKWTDTSGIKWKSNGEKSYLKSILTNRKYQVISPLYITSIYCEYIKKYENNYDKFNGIFEKHLNNIIINFKNECKKFKKQYNEIVDSYVYEHPLTNDPSYVLGFINSVILAILIFAEKLIELNIYAIHPIVVQLIEYYTPLDEINQYDPSENHGKKLCII